MDALKKVYQIEIKKDDIDEDESTLLATVSSEKRDRDGEIIRLSKESVDLTGYRKNPVLLWQHRADNPIGKAVWIKTDKRTLLAKFRFHRRTQISKEIYDLYKTGFLNSFSIGFKPTIPRDENKVFRKIELLEISAVSIPSNTDAITQNDYGEKITDNILRKDLSLESLESPAPIFNADIFATALKKALDPNALKEIASEGIQIEIERIKKKVDGDKLIEVDLAEVQRLVDKNILEMAMKENPELAKKIISKRIQRMQEIEMAKILGRVI